MAIRLSVGIVVYRPDFAVLKQTLQHIELAAEGIEFICYIVNNAPDMQSFHDLQVFIKQFNFSIELIHNPENTGYGAGNNLVIRKTMAPYHLVLNPDAFLHQDALKNALSYMDEHQDVGLLCPKVLNEDGSQQFVHRRHPTLFDMFLRSGAPVFLQRFFQRRMDQFEFKHLDWQQEQAIASPSGCCMLFRTSLLTQVGGFDERYFMYYEDSDIGRSIAKIAEVKYLPSFEVTHLWARAARKSSRMRRIMMKSGFLYFLKWRGWF